MRNRIVVSAILLLVAILALAMPWYSVTAGQQVSQTTSCLNSNACTTTTTSFSTSTSTAVLTVKGFVFMETVRLPCSGVNCPQDTFAQLAIFATDGRIYFIQTTTSPPCNNQPGCLPPEVRLPPSGSFVQIHGSLIVPAKITNGTTCDPVSCKYIYGTIQIQSWTMIVS